MKTLNINNILVDDSRKLMFCMVPKVACTNWIRTLALTSKNISLTGLKSLYYNTDLAKEEITENTVWSQQKVEKLIKTYHQTPLHTPRFNRAVGMAHLHAFPPEGIAYRIKHYYKFMFVRHPFVRLLSAFRDKLEKAYDKQYRLKFGKEIIRKFRSNPSQRSLDTGDDVTFVEFVNFLFYIMKHGKQLNPHWNTYFNLCHPCVMHYDFIGKFETMTQEFMHVIPHLTESPYTSQFLAKQYGPNTNTTIGIVKKYYHQLNTDNLFKLRKMYDIDFIMFGYDHSF